jgi:hypothetical protein
MEASDYTAENNGQSPLDAHEASADAGHPEVPVLAAFAGGFIVARILKALGGDDD